VDVETSCQRLKGDGYKTVSKDKAAPLMDLGLVGRIPPKGLPRLPLLSSPLSAFKEVREVSRAEGALDAPEPAPCLWT